MATKVPYEAENNIKRFNEGVNGIYGGPDIYRDNPGFNFGFRQPYVWTKLTDSNFKKYIKKFDSRSFPIGSTIQDFERLGKFLISGKGIFFLGTQFLLQGKNAFNETSLYNPLSIPQSILSKSSFGLIPPPIRHFPINGSDAISQLLGNTNTSAPIGTLKSAVDGIKVMGGGKGLQRARSTTQSTYNFETKYGVNSSSLKKDLFSNLASMIFPNLGIMPVQKGKYKLYDTETFKIMVENTQKESGQFSLYTSVGKVDKPLMPFGKQYFGNNKKEFTFNNNSVENTNSNVVSFTYSDKLYSKAITSDLYGILSKTILNVWKDSKNSLDFNGNNKDKLVDNISSNKRNQNEPSTTISKYSDIPEDRTSKRFLSGVNGSSADDKVVELKKTSLKSIYGELSKYVKTPGEGNNNFPEQYKPFVNKNPNGSDVNYNYIKSYNEIPNKDSDKRIKKTWEDDYNFIQKKDGKISYNDTINNNYFFDTTDSLQSDFIQLYFHDIVNNKYIQFRSANLKFTSLSSQAEWEDVKYIGRSDRVWVYKGISQKTISPSFTVYASNKNEMYFIYKKANYLMGLTYPSNYSTVDNASYMIPPFVKFTCGNLYKNVPVIFKNVDIDFPEDFAWDIDIYKVPMGMNITVQMDMLESSAPKANETITFGNIE